MGRLIYSMLTSLDGYTEDEHGRFGWGAPEDEEVHSYINALASSLGTYLYGRRMYETMVYWETAHTFTHGPLPSRAAHERVLNGSSIQRRSGGSKPTSSTTSPLMAPNSPGRRRWKAILPRRCPAGPGAARGAPVRQRRAHPAVRRPRGCSWLIRAIRKAAPYPITGLPA
jgi:hypothetical protein